MKKTRERSSIRGNWDGEPVEDFSGCQIEDLVYYYGFDKDWFPLGGGWSKSYAYIRVDPKTTTIIIPSEFT